MAAKNNKKSDSAKKDSAKTKTSAAAKQGVKKAEQSAKKPAAAKKQSAGDKSAAAPARKAESAKKAAVSKKAEPAKKAAAMKKAEPQKKATPVKKAEGVRKAAVSKKAEPAKKAEPQKKAESAKKAEPAKKAAATKKAEPQKKTESAKKTDPAKKAEAAKKSQADHKKSEAVKKESTKAGKKAAEAEWELPDDPEAEEEAARAAAEQDEEEALSPEAMQALFDEKLKSLLNGAKKTGFIEYQEVIDSFSELNLDEEQFDRIWDALDKNRIVLRIEQIEDDDIPEEELALEEGAELDLDMESLEAGISDGANIEDPVRMYLKEIGRVPLLNAEEEIELAKRMEAGMEATEKNEELNRKIEKLKVQEKEARKNKNTQKAAELAKKRKDMEKRVAENELKIEDGKLAGKDLSNANLRLVVSIAKRYVGRGMLFLDLIQEGNLGLIKAVEKFDYRKGYKFSTYATWWIRQAITRAIADQARTIRIPVHMVETINKIIRINRQLLQELGREPSPQEIAERMDMPEERVREILKISQEPVSLETPIGEEEDSHLGDFIQDDNVPVPADAAAFTLLREQLDEILDTLTERERKVLTLRFGLIDGRARTLEEVGKEFSVTRERIRQIEAKALRKLRHPSRSKRIRDYLDE